MIEIDIDFGDLERLQKAVGVTAKIADKSMRRALKRTERWLGTRVKREVAAATKLPVGAVKGRVKLGKLKGGKLEARVWVGLDPIKAGRAGKPSGAKPGSNKGGAGGRGRKAGPGVKVGKHRFPDAFILDGKRVVRRTTTKRFPLENVTIPIHNDAHKALVRKSWPEAQKFFLNEFERLLRYELQRLNAS